MSHNLTEVDEFTTNVTVPDDGDTRDASSVITPIQAVANRTKYFKTIFDTITGFLVGGDVISCTDSSNVSVSEITAILIGSNVYSTTGDTILTSSDVTGGGGFVANTRYYIYVFVSGSSLDFMISTVAPDTYLTWKSDAVGTHRYLGTFYADGTNSVQRFRKHGRKYILQRIHQVLNNGAATSYTDVDLVTAKAIPAHVRMVSLQGNLQANGATSVDALTVRTNGDTDSSNVRTLANTYNSDNIEQDTKCVDICTDSNGVVEYKILDSAHLADIHVVGFWE